jgi:hypothetical protein
MGLILNFPIAPSPGFNIGLNSANRPSEAGKPVGNRDRQHIARQERIKPLVTALEGWMRTERARLSRHTDTAKRNDHPRLAVGSRKVRASGNAAAQRAAIAQNPCAPKRSKIGPQASVSRAVATPMPTVP